MSKYDFELDLSLHSSTGIILNKIAPKSVVLEFGCAAGRMTRYMQEALGCSVYIVEYDSAAFQKALAYAADGLCDDILNFKWMERFGNIRFDVIIFSDVLEHLPIPEKVLASAASLLKEDGSIYVSIPNITHNDILLKAYAERFDYTATGILDDTHIHFWGMQNLSQLAQQSGLALKCVEATYCDTGHTEQFYAENNTMPILLDNILKERQCGEIYQFVLTLDKSIAAEPVYKIKPPVVKSHIYFDTGSDFNAEEIVEIEAVYSGNGSYMVQYVIDNPKHIKRVKFDPVEGQSCILLHGAMTQGDTLLSLVCPNAVKVKDGILLPGQDPMVYADTCINTDAIRIDAEIVLAGERFIAILQDAYTEKDTELGLLTAEKEAIAQQAEFEKNRILEELQRVAHEKDTLVQQLENLQNRYRVTTEKMEHMIAEQVNQNEVLRNEIGAYVVLATKKDSYALRLKQELNQTITELERVQTENQRQQALLMEQSAHIAGLEHENAYLKNLKVVRIRMYAARIVKGMLRRIKRLFGKV